MKIISWVGDKASVSSTFTQPVTWEDVPNLLGGDYLDLAIGSVTTRPGEADEWKAGVCSTELTMHSPEQPSS